MQQHDPTKGYVKAMITNGPYEGHWIWILEPKQGQKTVKALGTTYNISSIVIDGYVQLYLP